MAVWWRSRTRLGPFSSFAPAQGSTDNWPTNQHSSHCIHIKSQHASFNIVPLSLAPMFQKVRYLLLGGAIGGGGALARQYDDWKNNLPDTAWLKKAMPDVDLDKFRTSLLSLKDTVKGKVGEVEMDPALKAAGWDKYQEFRGWFDKRLDSAIQAAIEEGRQEDVPLER